MSSTTTTQNQKQQMQSSFQPQKPATQQQSQLNKQNEFFSSLNMNLRANQPQKKTDFSDFDKFGKNDDFANFGNVKPQNTFADTSVATKNNAKFDFHDDEASIFDQDKAFSQPPK